MFILSMKKDCHSILWFIVYFRFSSACWWNHSLCSWSRSQSSYRCMSECSTYGGWCAEAWCWFSCCIFTQGWIIYPQVSFKDFYLGYTYTCGCVCTNMTLQKWTSQMCGPTGVGFLYGKTKLLSAMPPFLGKLISLHLHWARMVILLFYTMFMGS